MHSNVNKFNGACNKNIGESFLLVWKFKNIDKEEEKKEETATKTNNEIMISY